MSRTKKRRNLDIVLSDLRDELAAQRGWGMGGWGEGALPEPTKDILQRYTPRLDAVIARGPSGDAAIAPDRSRDASLLRDPASGSMREWVPKRIATKYSGKTDEHIDKLIREEKLRAKGVRGSRCISVEDLLNRWPLQK